MKTMQHAQYATCGGTTQIFRVKDAPGWVAISSHDLPTRYVRISDDPASLVHLLQTYGYADKNNCVNTVPKPGDSPVLPVRHDDNFWNTVPMRDNRPEEIDGVKQRAINSGICWYAALCFVLFYSDAMRNFMLRYLPDEMHAWAKKCLTDTDAAEALRRALYHKFEIGDKPDQAPELDGQNGCQQFLALAAKLDIPVLVRDVTWGANLVPGPNAYNDVHGNRMESGSVARHYDQMLLVVRSHRTAWVPNRGITVHIDNEPYYFKLMGHLVGASTCSHQVGSSAHDMGFHNTRRWAHADADARSRGIYPMYWQIEQEARETQDEFTERWRRSWDHMLPITFFNGGQECKFNPSNNMDSPSINVEFFYLYDRNRWERNTYRGHTTNAILVGRDACPHCVAAKELLQAHEISYTMIYPSDAVGDYKKKLEKMGTIPQIWINDEYIGGRTDLEKKIAN